MIVLVCGGRDYKNGKKLFDVLNNLHFDRGPISKIIHGGAKGADYLAGRWAYLNRVDVSIFHAKWDELGRSAGPIRNAEMIKTNPEIALSFPGGVGTADLLRRAYRAGCEVIKVIDDPPN